MHNCQHVESGACANCTDFRSPESIKKGLQDKPFAALSVFVNDKMRETNALFILPKPVLIYNWKGEQRISFGA